MYLGSFGIDDYVGIPAATHRFSSGAAYAPTSLTYSIYEEEASPPTGIDENVDMIVAAPLDGIVGCYWVRRQLTTAAGFEVGKNYVVVVKATVDSVAAIQMHTFQVEARVRSNMVAILGTALTETAGLIAAGFKKFFNIATPTGTVNSLPDAVPGANGGVFIAGANAATSVTTALTANITGDLSGSVGSVTGAVTLAASQLVFKKNVARANFAFPMYDSTGALKSGLTVTAEIRKDAGVAFAALAGSVSEIGSTGWYTVDFAQAETNADTIAFSASAAGANPTCYTILTQA